MTELHIGGMVCIGHTKVAWLPNVTRYPEVTLDDFTAPGAMNASFFLMGGFGLVFADGRWQVRGCRYITDPQHPDSQLSGLLKPEESGFFAFRYGPLATTDWSLSDVVNLVPCVLGPRAIVPSEQSEFAMWVYDQRVFVSGRPLLGVQIATAKAMAA